jgi:hypothetical protein
MIAKKQMSAIAARGLKNEADLQYTKDNCRHRLASIQQKMMNIERYQHRIVSMLEASEQGNPLLSMQNWIRKYKVAHDASMENTLTIIEDYGMGSSEAEEAASHNKEIYNRLSAMTQYHDQYVANNLEHKTMDEELQWVRYELQALENVNQKNESEDESDDEESTSTPKPRRIRFGKAMTAGIKRTVELMYNEAAVHTFQKQEEEERDFNSQIEKAVYDGPLELVEFEELCTGVYSSGQESGDFTKRQRVDSLEQDDEEEDNAIFKDEDIFESELPSRCSSPVSSPLPPPPPPPPSVEEEEPEPNVPVAALALTPVPLDACHPDGVDIWTTEFLKSQPNLLDLVSIKAIDCFKLKGQNNRSKNRKVTIKDIQPMTVDLEMGKYYPPAQRALWPFVTVFFFSHDTCSNDRVYMVALPGVDVVFSNCYENFRKVLIYLTRQDAKHTMQEIANYKGTHAGVLNCENRDEVMCEYFLKSMLPGTQKGTVVGTPTQVFPYQSLIRPYVHGLKIDIKHHQTGKVASHTVYRYKFPTGELGYAKLSTELEHLPQCREFLKKAKATAVVADAVK